MPTLTSDQIRLAYNIEAVQEALAAGFVLPPLESLDYAVEEHDEPFRPHPREDEPKSEDPEVERERQEQIAAYARQQGKERARITSAHDTDAMSSHDAHGVSASQMNNAEAPAEPIAEAHPIEPIHPTLPRTASEP